MNGRFQTAAGYSPPIISRSERVLAKGFSPRMNRRLIEVGRWQQRRRVRLGDKCGAIGDDAVAIESAVMTRLRCCRTSARCRQVRAVATEAPMQRRAHFALSDSNFSPLSICRTRSHRDRRDVVLVLSV